MYALIEFEFIVGFLIVYQFLSYLAGITIKLQSRTFDVVDAHCKIDSIQSYYKVVRQNIDRDFHKVYVHAERMAEAVNVQPSSCGRQINRHNVVTSTIEGWYKFNVAIPFIDHIIADLECRCEDSVFLDVPSPFYIVQ